MVEQVVEEAQHRRVHRLLLQEVHDQALHLASHGANQVGLGRGRRAAGEHEGGQRGKPGLAC